MYAFAVDHDADTNELLSKLMGNVFWVLAEAAVSTCKVSSFELLDEFQTLNLQFGVRMLCCCDIIITRCASAELYQCGVSEYVFEKYLFTT